MKKKLSNLQKIVNCLNECQLSSDLLSCQQIVILLGCTAYQGTSVVDYLSRLSLTSSCVSVISPVLSVPLLVTTMRPSQSTPAFLKHPLVFCEPGGSNTMDVMTSLQMAQLCQRIPSVSWCVLIDMELLYQNETDDWLLFFQSVLSFLPDLKFYREAVSFGFLGCDLKEDANWSDLLSHRKEKLAHQLTHQGQLLLDEMIIQASRFEYLLCDMNKKPNHLYKKLLSSQAISFSKLSIFPSFSAWILKSFLENIDEHISLIKLYFEEHKSKNLIQSIKTLEWLNNHLFEKVVHSHLENIFLWLNESLKQDALSQVDRIKSYFSDDQISPNDFFCLFQEIYTIKENYYQLHDVNASFVDYKKYFFDMFSNHLNQILLLDPLDFNKNQLEKLASLAKYFLFTGHDSHLGFFQEKIVIFLTSIHELFQKYIQNNQWNSGVSLLYDCHQCIKNYIKNDFLKDYYVKIEVNCLNHLSECFDNLLSLSSDLPIQNEQLYEICSYLEKIKNIEHLNIPINKEKIISLERKVLIWIEETHLNHLYREILRCDERFDHEKFLGKIEIAYVQATILSKFYNKKINPVYQRIKKIILNRLMTIKEYFFDIQQAVSEEENVNLIELVRLLKTIKKNIWLDDILPDLRKDIFFQVKESFLAYFETLKVQMIEFDLELPSNQTFEKMNMLIEKLDLMKNLDIIFPDFSENRALILNEGFSKLSAVFEKPEEASSDLSIPHIKSIENRLSLLNNTNQSFNHLSHFFIKMKRGLSHLVLDKFSHLQEEIIVSQSVIYNFLHQPSKIDSILDEIEIQRSRFDQLLYVKELCPFLSKFEIIKEIFRKIQEFHKNILLEVSFLLDSLFVHQEFFKIDNILQHLYYLKAFDFFLDDKHIPVYIHYNRLFLKKLSDYKKEIKNSIVSGNYLSVSSGLRKFSELDRDLSGNFYSELLHELIFYFENQFDDMDKKIVLFDFEMTTENLNSLKNLINLFFLLKTSIVEYREFLDPSRLEKLKSQLKKVKSFFNQVIEMFHQNTELAIDNRDFYHAELNLRYLNKIIFLLKLKNFRLSFAIDDLKTHMSHSINKFIEEASFFSDDLFKLKNSFSSLHQASKLNPNYLTVIDQAYQNIQQTFRDKLNDLEIDYVDNKVLLELEYKLSHFPPEIRHRLSLCLDSLKESMRLPSQIVWHVYKGNKKAEKVDHYVAYLVFTLVFLFGVIYSLRREPDLISNCAALLSLMGTAFLFGYFLGHRKDLSMNRPNFSLWSDTEPRYALDYEMPQSRLSP